MKKSKCVQIADLNKSVRMKRYVPGIVYLNSNGRQVDDDFLVARYARIASEDKRHELILFYLESLRDLNLTRSELEQGGSRSSEREKIFAEFTARGRQSFKVVADGK